MNEYLEIEIGTSSYKNSGIVGLIYMLRNYEAVEGDDFIIEKYKVKIKLSYLKDLDITDAFTKAYVEKFRTSTSLYRLIQSFDKLEIMESAQREKAYKDIKKKIKEMRKNRYTSQILNVKLTSEENLKLAQKLEDTISKIIEEDYNKEDLQELKSILLNPNIFEYLSFADIKLKISEYWDGILFLNRQDYRKDFKMIYQTKMEQVLKKYIFDEYDTGTRQCVECGNLSKDYFNISFIGQITDSGRKKSYFWDFKEEANVCPVCAFLYTLMPLGYVKVGQDSLFINSNSSIYDLVKMNEKVEFLNEERESLKGYLFKKISLLTLEQYSQNIGVQIDLRSSVGTSKKREQVIIEPNLINLFKNKKECFEKVYSKIVKCDDGFYDVYDHLIESLLRHQTLYTMINYLQRQHEKNGGSNYYLLYLLDIEMYQKYINKKRKGEDMVINNRRAQYLGIELKKEYLKNKSQGYLDGKMRNLRNALRKKDYIEMKSTIEEMYYAVCGHTSDEMALIINSDDKEIVRSIATSFLIGLSQENKDGKQGELYE